MSKIVETNIARFELVGPNKGKTCRLGSNNHYKFEKGFMDLTCSEDDAKKHANVLKRFYSAKRVRVIYDEDGNAEAPKASVVKSATTDKK